MTALLSLRVSPGASRPSVVGRYGTAWKIRVAEPPEDGKANAAVVRLLAAELGVARRDIKIVAGLASRDKTLVLAGIDSDEMERRLVRASGGGEDPA
ncbi:MAG TPA: DUF167 domain-containing protein [Gaiellaceae bacterium]|nr:DUF167 domain-containing protein [Gaiellaceae bacterium]